MNAPTLVDADTGEIVELEWPHHEAADLFPMLPDDELVELAADIERNGLIEPIWLYDDPERGRVLLDGRNRLAACRLADVTPTTQMYRGDDPIGFSLSLNCTRRHLTSVQKAKAAYAALPMFEADARRRMMAGKRADPGAPVPQGAERGPRARDLAAKRVGISGRTLAEYKRVAEQAPDLLPQVEAEQMSLRKACRIIRERERAAATDAAPEAPQATGGKSRADIEQKIATYKRMAAEGYTSRQIGEAIGVAGVSSFRKRHSLEAPPADAVVGRTRNHDSNRILSEMVYGLEAFASTIELIDVGAIDADQLDEWATSLKESIRSVSRFVKELSHVQQ